MAVSDVHGICLNCISCNESYIGMKRLVALMLQKYGRMTFTLLDIIKLSLNPDLTIVRMDNPNADGFSIELSTHKENNDGEDEKTQDKS